MMTPSCTEQLRAVAEGLLQPAKPFALLAIDGRCGSGKTSLAETLRDLPCQIIHTDDFYLPPAARIANWAETPAANMDFARLRAELLLPLREGQAGSYTPYSCRMGALGETTKVEPKGLVVVEGSYALHPSLRNLYDAKVFLTCTPAVQATRLMLREGARYDNFAKRWIPLEEGYFAAENPAACCDLVLDTSGAF